MAQKWPKNEISISGGPSWDQKRTQDEKNDPKRPFVAPNDLKWAKNGPKMTQNGPKMAQKKAQERNREKTAARFLQFLT